MTMINIKSPAASSGPQFHLFSRLPAELRIMIWQMSLPEKIVEINHPSWLAQQTQCNGQWTEKKNISLPKIAQVSWEARKIALGDIAKAPVGLHGRKNIVLAYEDGDNRPEEIVQNYEDSAIDMAICTNHNGDWSHSFQLNLPSDHQLTNPLVVICIVAIHAKKEDVLSSGVFGNLGDAPIQLLDPIDEERIVKFRQLCVAHGIPQSKPDIAFLKRWTRSPEKLRLFRAMVEK
ncbi:hypothetical protein PoHVEF18_006597 [Penicillium ochrochloron]